MSNNNNCDQPMQLPPAAAHQQQGHGQHQQSQGRPQHQGPYQAQSLNIPVPVSNLILPQHQQQGHQGYPQHQNNVNILPMKVPEIPMPMQGHHQPQQYHSRSCSRTPTPTQQMIMQHQQQQHNYGPIPQQQQQQQQQQQHHNLPNMSNSQQYNVAQTYPQHQQHSHRHQKFHNQNHYQQNHQHQRQPTPTPMQQAQNIQHYPTPPQQQYQMPPPNQSQHQHHQWNQQKVHAEPQMQQNISPQEMQQQVQAQTHMQQNMQQHVSPQQMHQQVHMQQNMQQNCQARPQMQQEKFTQQCVAPQERQQQSQAQSQMQQNIQQNIIPKQQNVQRSITPQQMQQQVEAHTQIQGQSQRQGQVQPKIHTHKKAKTKMRESVSTQHQVQEKSQGQLKMQKNISQKMKVQAQSRINAQQQVQVKENQLQPQRMSMQAQTQVGQQQQQQSQGEMQQRTGLVKNIQCQGLSNMNGGRHGTCNNDIAKKEWVEDHNSESKQRKHIPPTGAETSEGASTSTSISTQIPIGEGSISSALMEPISIALPAPTVLPITGSVQATGPVASKIKQKKQKTNKNVNVKNKGNGNKSGTKRKPQKLSTTTTAGGSSGKKNPQDLNGHRDKFYGFLVKVNKKVDDYWPRLEKAFLRAAMHLNNEDETIAEVMKGICQFRSNLLQLRITKDIVKSKIVKKNFSLKHLLQRVAYFTLLDIGLLKGGFERCHKDFLSIHTRRQEMFQVESEELGKFLKKIVDLESIVVKIKSQVKNTITKNAVGASPKKDPSQKAGISSGTSVQVPSNLTKGIKISEGLAKGRGRGIPSGGVETTGNTSNGKKRKAIGVANGSSSGKKKPVSEHAHDVEPTSTTHGQLGGDGNKKKMHSHGPNVTIIDDHPERLTNPLLELPQGSLVGDPTLPVSEFLKLGEIYLPEPDTFPLSYYRKILGVDPPASTDNDSKKSETYSKGDEWITIPPLGKYGKGLLRNDTLANVDENGSQRNRDDDYVDPTWIAILNEYRGFRNDELKQATEMNEPCIISKDCLRLAQKLQIVGRDVEFRNAVLNDVGMFDDEQTWGGYSSSTWLSTILKSGNHFIILATSENNELLGFIHYRFCWFRPRGLGILTSDEVALERVFHVESIRCKASIGGNRAICESFSNLNAVIVLFSLAIEHVRIHAIYGMMNLSPYIASMLKKYFRMSEVAADSDRVLLVCDLHKCSYRFACHSRKEEMEKIPKRNISKYRFLVQLPTVSRTPIMQSQQTNQSGSNESVPVSAKSDEIHGSNGTIVKTIYPSYHTPHMIQRSQQPDDFEFSSCSSVCKQKSMIVRVESDKVRFMKGPNRSPQKGSKQKAFEPSLNQDKWNVISCFRVPVTSENLIGGLEDDHVVLSLKSLQEDLASLERSNGADLQMLLRSVYDERQRFEDERPFRAAKEQIVTEYEAEVQRRIDAQKAVELKEEEEENAVCDICGDGESTGENRIIFCDYCDVSVHQHCYGVDNVPRGDYFCRACQYFKQDQPPKAAENQLVLPQPKHPPINCELCPKKYGAFVQTLSCPIAGEKNPPKKWVHFLCAKWQGLSIVDGAMENGAPVFMVENVQTFKDHFRSEETRCYLCKGMRGCYNKCRHEGCDRWMHVTCARSSGICEVIHGDDHIGPVDSDNVWTLCCPEHSTFSEDYTPLGKKVALDDLVALAKTYPVEPKPLPPPEPIKPFHKMNGKERRLRLKDPEYEKEFVNILMKEEFGLRCEVCDGAVCPDTVVKCEKCSSVVHKGCISDANSWKFEQVTEGKYQYQCNSCVRLEERQNNKALSTEDGPLECHMCFSKRGTLIRCSATPVSMKKWKNKMALFKKSLFGNELWCHPICGLWHSRTEFDEDGAVNCSNIIMSHGHGHIDGKQYCALCGFKTGAKMQCTGVTGTGKQQKMCPLRFHATCARQAGFEVAKDHPIAERSLMCYTHGRCEYAFRAMLEDMIEFEKLRAGNDLRKNGGSMTLETASNIFNAGVRVIRCFGWAWQWAVSWVHYGDNWEPLLEVGQNEADLSREQLRYVDSTPTSRREDARRCRLAAFGAALRNRDYDKNEGDDRVALHNALRAILSTKSLVGPLHKAEIEFFVEWLGRVYRSKSPLMALGDDRMPVNEEWQKDSPVFFRDDNCSPKYILGSRKLPGKCLKKNSVFEIERDDVDDYFENEDRLVRLVPSVQKPAVQNEKKKKKPSMTIPKKKSPEGVRSITKKKAKSKKRKSPIIEPQINTTKRLPKESSLKPRRGRGRQRIHDDDSMLEVEKIPISSRSTRRRKGNSSPAVTVPAEVLEIDKNSDLDVVISIKPKKETVSLSLDDPIPKRRRL